MPHTRNSTARPMTSRSSATQLLIVYFICVVVWFGVTVYTLGIFRSEMTRLILRSEGCLFLSQNGILTEASATNDQCTAIVLFTPSPFGNGGHVTLGEREVTLSDSQVVAVAGVIENQP